jgi:hypothetical protein
MDRASEQRLREAIRRYFRELKEAEADLIADELIRRGSMGEVLGAVGLPDPGYSDDQYASLLNHIRRMGFPAVAVKLRTGIEPPLKIHPSSSAHPRTEDRETTLDPDHRPAPRHHKPAGVVRLPGKRSSADNASGTGTGTGEGPIRRVRASLPEIKEEDPPQTRHQTTPPQDRAPEKAKPVTPPRHGYGFTKKAIEPSGASRDAIRKPDFDPIEQAPDKAAQPPKAEGSWDGVERRSGKERRTRNRRGNVETIMKNHRFGRDRRSGKDRRKNPPPKPGQS